MYDGKVIFSVCPSVHHQGVYPRQLCQVSPFTASGPRSFPGEYSSLWSQVPCREYHSLWSQVLLGGTQSLGPGPFCTPHLLAKTGYTTGGMPLAVSHRRTFLFYLVKSSGKQNWLRNLGSATGPVNQVRYTFMCKAELIVFDL